MAPMGSHLSGHFVHICHSTGRRNLQIAAHKGNSLMPNLLLWVDCVPPKATSQQKGAVRTSKGIRFYKKHHVAAVEQELLGLLRSAIPKDWTMIESGPISLDVRFVWPWRNSEPQKNRIQPVRAMYVRPDCSNIIKMLEDALTHLKVWRDDSQVASLQVMKFWGDRPGISIGVKQIEEC